MTQFVKVFQKDPADVQDYVATWNIPGDTIDTSSYTVGAGLTKDSESNTTTTTTVWLSGGNAGQAYTVTNLITTTGGRTISRSFQVVVLDL